MPAQPDNKTHIHREHRWAGDTTALATHGNPGGLSFSDHSFFVIKMNLCAAGGDWVHTGSAATPPKKKLTKRSKRMGARGGTAHANSYRGLRTGEIGGGKFWHNKSVPKCAMAFSGPKPFFQVSFLALLACTFPLCNLLNRAHCARTICSTGPIVPAQFALQGPSIQEMTATNQRPIGNSNYHSRPMLVPPQSRKCDRKVFPVALRIGAKFSPNQISPFQVSHIPIFTPHPPPPRYCAAHPLDPPPNCRVGQVRSG